VTIVCARRRLDLALPTSVCCSELVPGLLRLMLPDEPTAAADPWVIVPISGDPLAGPETLSDAGVLAGDMLTLTQLPERQPVSTAVTSRDRIEDVMNSEERFWDPGASRSFTQWAALAAGSALLLPAAQLAAGPATAAMAATVAVIVAMTAALSGRRCEKVCAAVGLALGCLWAAFAGVAAFQGWAAAVPLTGAAAGVLTLLVGTGSALLLAGCAAVGHPAALAHLTSLLVVGIACAGMVAAVNAGASVIDAGAVVALVAVLLLGGLPRVSMAVGGLTGSAPRRGVTDLDGRIDRGDRVLIGCLVGVSTVAVGAAIPGALSSASGPRLLTVGIGLLLLLRSRAYTQKRHVIAPRVGALLMFGVGWLGLYRDVAAPKSALIVGAAVAAAVVVIAFDVLGRTSSAVGLARRGRFLELSEQALVVVLIVLLAWVVVLADWVVAVIG
jgi:type VII secretion integral membrane protein EccD